MTAEIDTRNGTRALTVQEQAREVVTPERLDATSQAIALARTPEEVKTIRDKMEAIEVYARRRGHLREANQITTIRLEAERRLGEFLRSMPRNEGGRKARKPVRGQDGLPTLKELGFTRNQASLWGQLAAIPKGEFRRVVDLLIQEERELGTRSVIAECYPRTPKKKTDKGRATDETPDTLRDDDEKCYWFKSELPEKLARKIREIEFTPKLPEPCVIVGVMARNQRSSRGR